VSCTDGGPTHKAFAALDADGQRTPHSALIDLLRRENWSGREALMIAGEYVDAVVTPRARRRVCLPARRARPVREAKTTAGLNHPHICTLHDGGERYFFVASPLMIWVLCAPLVVWMRYPSCPDSQTSASTYTVKYSV
jgi:hypothetical protein